MALGSWRHLPGYATPLRPWRPAIHCGKQEHRRAKPERLHVKPGLRRAMLGLLRAMLGLLRELLHLRRDSRLEHHAHRL